MKKASLLGLLVLLLLATVGWSQSDSGTEDTVAKLEQQWLQGIQTSNPDLIAPLLADSFVNTGMDGKVTGKADTLADTKSSKFESADNNDVEVTLFGGTAIATGGFKGKGTDGSGKAIDVNERWTDTWVKMPDGKWQCVASQGTPVKM